MGVQVAGMHELALVILLAAFAICTALIFCGVELARLVKAVLQPPTFLFPTPTIGSSQHAQAQRPPDAGERKG